MMARKPFSWVYLGRQIAGKMFESDVEPVCISHPNYPAIRVKFVLNAAQLAIFPQNFILHLNRNSAYCLRY